MNYQRPHVAGAESQLNHVSQSTAGQLEPLVINGGEVEAQSPALVTKVSYWSLPNKGQLALMCVARMADPLAATSIQVQMRQVLRVRQSGLTLRSDVHVLSAKVL